MAAVESKSTMGATINHLIAIWFFTYVGVLWRVAVSTLCETAHNPGLTALGTSFFLANIIGSYVMGLATGLVDAFKPYQSWHVGLTVGFCGSCTTFSSWQKSMTVEFLTGSWITALIQMFTNYVSSYCIFCCGYHSGTTISKAMESHRAQVNSARSYEKSNKFSIDLLVLLIITIVITVALWCGIFLDHAEYRRNWWVALSLGPIGSSIRFALSKYNPKFPTFPLFTFIVNAVGSALSVSFYVGQRFLSQNSNPSLALYDFWIINGLGVGALGSLTTVSTFVKEMYNLSKQSFSSAYRYGIVSVIIVQILCIGIGCAIFA